MGVVLAVDAGTTGIRTLAFDENGSFVDSAYRELVQHYPRPGWVEHDASEIWAHVASTLSEVTHRQREARRSVAAIGVTNQRETLVAWRRSTGEPIRPAIVWQDRRSAGLCDRLREEGHEDFVRDRTGLVLDSYFTATKMSWLIGGEGGPFEMTSDLVLSTVDAWVIWNLTGGTDGGVLVTDATNASRTLLYDIHDRNWSSELTELFGVPLRALPDLVPSSGRVGTTAGDLGGPGSGLSAIPVSGIAGDQHAALFGQACFRPGMAKVTNGTGSFVLLTLGTKVPVPVEGVLTTVAWDLGDRAGPDSFMYALEGSVFVSGAAIQWLRDGLGIIATASEVGDLAESIPDTEGVFVVPAFAGLGSPWWDPYARGAIVGLTGGVGRAHLARAVVESMAFQVRDVIDAMTGSGSGPAVVPTMAEQRDPGSGSPRLEVLRVDGGASVMDLLLQLLADQLQAPVARPVTTETTALGAAMLAGLAVGVWGSLEELASVWKLDAQFEPRTTRTAADSKHTSWLSALDRARNWV
ncbi:MAG: FGGY family carbohydrate kinase [Acidimicrobiales bacterium]